MSDIPEKIARELYAARQRLAPEHGLEEGPVPWEQVPTETRDLMVAAVAELIDRRVIQPATLRRFSSLEEMADPAGVSGADVRSPGRD